MIVDFRIIEECEKELLDFILRHELVAADPIMFVVGLLDVQWSMIDGSWRLDDRLFGLRILSLQCPNGLLETALVIEYCQIMTEYRVLVEISTSNPTAYLASFELTDDRAARLNKAAAWLVQALTMAPIS